MRPLPETVYYNAIKQAETGSINNPWIRTQYAPKEGSSAFGPVQITKTKLMDYIDRFPSKFDKEDKEFINTIMLPMYNKFLKYGKEPNLEGYDTAYDYGGHGYFDEDKYSDEYRDIANTLLRIDYNEADGDINELIKSWRGVSDDARYNKAVKDALGITDTTVTDTTVNDTDNDTYTIKKGDTLSEIAASNNTTIKKLQNLNNIKNPNKIQAGNTIKLKESE